MPRHGPFGGHTRQGLCNRVPLPAPTWPLPRHIYILSSVNKKEVRVTEACLHLCRGEPAWVAEKKAERKSAADLCPRAQPQPRGPVPGHCPVQHFKARGSLGTCHPWPHKQARGKLGKAWRRSEAPLPAQISLTEQRSGDFSSLPFQYFTAPALVLGCSLPQGRTEQLPALLSPERGLAQHLWCHFCGRSLRLQRLLSSLSQVTEIENV